MFPPTSPPFPYRLETTRLILRPPQPGDGRPVNDAIRETFAALTQWMPWAKTMPSIDDTETFARDAWSRFRAQEDYPLLLFDKATGEFVGASGLHPHDWSIPKFEIGYWVRASREGQGLITEAAIGITQFAFEAQGAQRLLIRCDSRNDRSAAVAERAGFVLEARLHNDMRDNAGELRETLQYVKFPD
ncbi:MAG: GNAT family N-acetyltransferase [Anaerolineae bacterium]|nr:GNAT family N-acetyltransferase [Anaerolineae bacterium]